MSSNAKATFNAAGWREHVRPLPTSVSVRRSYLGVHSPLSLRLWMLLWLIAGGASALAALNQSGPDHLVFGVAAAFGAWTFLFSGGNHIDPLGVWGLAFAVFVGGAGFLMPDAVFAANAGGLLPLSVALFFAQVVIVVVAWSAQGSRQFNFKSRATQLPLEQAFWVGVFTYLLGVALELVGDSDFALGLMLTAPLLVAAGTKKAAGRKRAGAAVVLMLGGYSFFFWNGFGRILLAQAILSVMIVIAADGKRNLTKVAVLIGATGYVSSQGDLLRRFLVDVLGLSGRGVDRGAESVWSPLLRAGQILDLVERGIHDPTWFDTFTAALVSWIPRRFWQDKPYGWGRDLAEFFAPEYVQSGHSEAGLALGEFLWAFGLVGIAVYVLTISLVIRLLQISFYRILSHSGWGDSLSIAYLITVLAAANLLSLFWTGTFTYIARLLIMTAPLFALWLVLRVRQHLRSDL